MPTTTSSTIKRIIFKNSIYSLWTEDTITYDADSYATVIGTLYVTNNSRPLIADKQATFNKADVLVLLEPEPTV